MSDPQKRRCARLFNCCTNDLEPDWTDFQALEIAGCATSDDGIISGIAAESAEFFGIYGIHHTGEREALTDAPERAPLSEAQAIAQEMAALSGLPVRLEYMLREAEA